MSSGQQKAIEDVLSDIEIVDTDFHLKEQQSDFIDYIEEPFHSLLSRGDKMYESSFYPSAGLLTPAHTGKVEMYDNKSREECIAGMELLNVDKVLATPSQNLYLSCVQHDELATALANAYNQWVLEEIIDEENGIFCPILVATQEPDKAAEEIDDRANEPGRVAVFVPNGGVHPPLGNDIYSPIYDAASDHDLPVMMHGASGTQMLQFPQQFIGTNRYMSNHVPTHAMAHMVNLTDMMVQGVFVRYPDTTFVFEESGLGWIPYMMRRLDNEYSEKQEDAPMLEQKPSEYIKDQCKFTSQPAEGADDPTYLSSIIRLFDGENNLMFSSDYPHLDFDYTDAMLRSLKGHLSKEEIENIYGRTAADVFDLN